MYGLRIKLSTSRLQKIFSLCIFYLENAVLSYANKIHVAFVAMEAIFSQHFIVFLLDFVFCQISMSCYTLEFKWPQLSRMYLRSVRPDLARYWAPSSKLVRNGLAGDIGQLRHAGKYVLKLITRFKWPYHYLSDNFVKHKRQSTSQSVRSRDSVIWNFQHSILPNIDPCLGGTRLWWCTFSPSVISERGDLHNLESSLVLEFAQMPFSAITRPLTTFQKINWVSLVPK